MTVFSMTVNTQITTAAGSITSFGVDENKELYLVSFDGNIYKFKPTITDIQTHSQVNNFQLFQNYPNPFNPSTKIRYSVPSVGIANRSKTQQVTLKIYDVLGNEVATLVNEEKPAGNYEVEFNSQSITKELSSGIYIYKLTVGIFIESRKMVLLK